MAINKVVNKSTDSHAAIVYSRLSNLKVYLLPSPYNVILYLVSL